MYDVSRILFTPKLRRRAGESEAGDAVSHQDSLGRIIGSMSNLLTIWLAHPETTMMAAFRERFARLPRVAFFECRFEDLPAHDCFVTAGNSFGIMTAGIDAAVVHFFGYEIMEKVQRHIAEHYLGEQPVGTAFIVETGHAKVPRLVHAPTMRVPGAIDDTAAVYNATWAALLTVYAHNAAGNEPIETVAFPAFGTGFGRMTFGEAARQMAVAYEHFLHPPAKLDWDAVIARQKAICYDGVKRVVRWG
jgi:O-acetyl-ADP-ribose deacetylase (regulator of RNase III)